MKSIEGLEQTPDFASILQQLDGRLSRIENSLNDTREPAFHKEWYTVAETAEILGKAPFTVREWARLDRIHARKRPSGRGRSFEWTIAHHEIERIKNNGLLPRVL